MYLKSKFQGMEPLYFVSLKTATWLVETRRSLCI
jgi:hypothetical protein